MNGETKMRHYTIQDLEDIATSAEHKEHLLAMLKALDSFCKENEIRYYLSGGTLLGAVRHKGFIPWDDDIDVNIPRPDCEKLMELSDGVIGSFYLLPPDCANGKVIYHYRLCDDSILLGEKQGGVLKEEVYPTCIDIYPIDGLPETEEKTEEYYGKIKELRRKVKTVLNPRPYGGMNVLKKVKKRLKNRHLENKGLERLFNDVIEYQEKIPFDTSEYIGVTSCEIHGTEERMKKTDYLPVVEVVFEGDKYPAPKCYDQYLSRLYGLDYMNIPPVHTHITKYFLLPFRAKNK